MPMKPLFPTLVLACAALVLALTGCTPAVQGREAMARGDYGAAVQYYREDLSRNPDSLEDRRRLGRSLYALGRSGEAETVLREALDLRPGDWEASYLLGLALIAQGETDAGFDSLRDVKVPDGAYWLKSETVCVADHVQRQDLPTDETLTLLERYHRILANRQDMRDYHNHANSVFLLGGDCPPMLHDVNYYLGIEW